MPLLRASRGLLEGGGMTRGTIRCTRCGGRMFIEYPYGQDHGYGWEAHCAACGYVRYPDPPAKLRPEPTMSGLGRSRRSEPCLPDHVAALRQWLAEHGGGEGVDVNLTAVATDLRCRHVKHLQIAMWKLGELGLAEVAFSHLRAARNLGGWRVRLTGAEVT